MPIEMELDKATPEELAQMETHEGMQFDRATGEAVCNGLRTGWFFLTDVTQSLPTPGQSLDALRSPQKVTPWGFLAEESAQRLMGMVAAVLPPPLTVSIGYGDANSQFPQSVQPKELQFRTVDTPGKVYRFQAGLIASAIARTTYYDSVLKVQKQAPEGVLRDLLGELNSQVAASQDS